MNLNKIFLIISISLLFIFSSCTAYKKIPYLQEAETLSLEQLQSTRGIFEAKIKPNDILSITVNSSTPGIANDFNLPLLPNNSMSVNQSAYTGTSINSGTLQNYIVDEKGNINFPVVGEISVINLTRTELENKIISLIYPAYITEKPIVNVRFLNFQVAVLGEVAKPGIYRSENNSMTLLDALAYAGDLTIYGKRNNVMLLRESAGGELSVHRIDLQNKDLLLQKDIYYLQQNDKIIVEPNKTKGNNSSIGTLETISLSAISLIISVIAIITR